MSGGQVQRALVMLTLLVGLAPGAIFHYNAAVM